MDGSYYLTRKYFLRKEELAAAVTSPEFYVELMFIGIAIALACLMAYLIRQRVKKHFEAHPPKRIDVEFILKPLQMLTQILALLYLSVVRPFAGEYGAGGALTDATIQLTLAYLVAKCVMTVVASRPMAYFIAFVIMVLAVLDVTGFMRSASTYLNSMAFDIGQFHISILGLVRGGVILVIVFWIAGFLSRTLESYLRRSSRLSYNGRELAVKLFRIFIYCIALMITLSAVGVDLTAFAVFGGALGVGVGLGLQKLTSNFVSGMTLLMEKSIQIGDLIEVGNNTGWVRQLNIRYALIETADGREIMIPNEELITTRVINWTHTSTAVRLEVKVSAAYNSDPKKVCDLLLQAAKEHKSCLKEPPPSAFLREFGDNALMFTLTFWIADVRDGRFGPKSDVMTSILTKFRDNNIGIPTPASNNKIENL